MAGHGKEGVGSERGEKEPEERTCPQNNLKIQTNSLRDVETKAGSDNRLRRRGEEENLTWEREKNLRVES